MKLVPLSDLFAIQYGNSFDLNMLNVCDQHHPNRINYVSRTKENNGVSAFVKLRENTPPFEPGLITVAGSGNSVLESFIQYYPFYTGYHVFLLRPLRSMQDVEKLFYCYCIRRNQYKYSFGRQANKTLKNLLVPDVMPKEFSNINLSELNTLRSIPISKKGGELNIKKWKYFQVSQIFDVKYGVNLELNAMNITNSGERMPFISRSGENNGFVGFVSRMVEITPNPSNTISVSGGGSVLECFVQIREYYSGRDLYYLVPKFESTTFVLLFIATVLKLEKYRFNYGRQANRTLKHLSIKLPVQNGKLDVDYMDQYIQSLPYSSSL